MCEGMHRHHAEYIVFQFYVVVELKEGTAILLSIFGEGRYAMSSVKVGQL